MECPFCNPDILGSVFYENEDFLAIYNIAPVLPGHAMVIPRKHKIRFLDLSEEEITTMVKLSRDVIKILQKAFNAQGFNWTIQEGEESGQTIEHLHMHILPRHTGDMADAGDWYPKLLSAEKNIIDSKLREKIKPEEMYKIVKQLRQIASDISG